MKSKKLGWQFWLAVGYMVALALLAIIGPNIGHSYKESITDPLLGPSAEYWFGTDELGRDIFARIAKGAQYSLLIGFCVQIFAVTIGLILGIAMVYAPKWIAIPIQRITDGMFAFPDLLLAIMIVGIFQMGIVPVIIALTVGSWPAVARLVKGQVATLKDREYVTAAKAMGASTFYQVTKHILPHLAGVIVAVMMVDVAATILAESTLSFLGIGIQPPEPSWGQLIAKGNIYKETTLNLLLWPCLFLSMTIFALNFLGDGLRALVDHKGSLAD